MCCVAYYYVLHAMGKLGTHRPALHALDLDADAAALAGQAEQRAALRDAHAGEVGPAAAVHLPIPAGPLPYSSQSVVTFAHEAAQKELGTEHLDDQLLL